MLARCRRFLDRVRGTQRAIFFLIMGYDLYLYYQMIQRGLLDFVVIVLGVGIGGGAVIAWALTKSPHALHRVARGSYYPVMAVFLLSQGAKVQFPMWVYLLSHILLWIGFMTYFWYASRPYAFEFDATGYDDEEE